MILDQLVGLFSSDMGIDLGTANTLVLVLIWLELVLE